MQNSCSNPYVKAGAQAECTGAGAQAEYAGFWVRLAAYAIDSLIVFFGLLVVRLFLAGVLSVLSGTWLGGNILFQYTLKDILLYVFQVLYFILCTWLTGTTLGKRAMNLRVISACPEEPLGLLDVVYRETIGRFLCSLSVGIGYIMAGVDKEKRGLHDFLCDTRVIYAKKIKVIPVYPRYQAPLVRPAGPGAPGNPPLPPYGGQGNMAQQPPPYGGQENIAQQPPFGGQETMAPPQDGQKID